MYAARDNQLERLQEISANDSIGILYSLITLHLGFDFNSDEYKIMGLAPYGDPTDSGLSFGRPSNDSMTGESEFQSYE